MNLVNGAVKRLCWPLCRAYARQLGDRPADTVLRTLCSLEFRRVYGFWPDFHNPTRFSEKLWRRQLFDRDPRFVLVSDKFRVRDYVKERVGEQYLIPLLWEGKNPDDIPFQNLPARFVIKANHGCDYNVIVKDKRVLDIDQTKRQLTRWLNENFGRDTYFGIAWAYKNIVPHILIETFLEENGKPPVDYKFFCFGGRMEYFKIDFDRFDGHAERFFDRERTPLNFIEIGLKLHEGEVGFPPNFSEMIQVAESLARGFDFLRVDLYNVGGQIYFGELTTYPGGTSATFSEETYDHAFGQKWAA